MKREVMSIFPKFLKFQEKEGMLFPRSIGTNQLTSESAVASRLFAFDLIHRNIKPLSYMYCNCILRLALAGVCTNIHHEHVLEL